MFYGDTDRYVKVTREEFYEQVWTIPTVQLSTKYGISDVYFARICREHMIPKPHVGYWAHRQHHYKVISKPLPRYWMPQHCRSSTFPNGMRVRTISNIGASDQKSHCQLCIRRGYCWICWELTFETITALDSIAEVMRQSWVPILQTQESLSVSFFRCVFPST